MTILITNTSGSNSVNLEYYDAKIIHTDKSVWVMLIDSKIVEDFTPDFCLPEEKIISVGHECDVCFHAKAWTFDSEFNGTSVLKFYAENQSWFEAVNLDLSYEYNEYVVGYIVTDKTTGRSANAQFSDRGNNDHALKFGCEGDDTHSVFTETELEAMTDWLREQNGVRELEDAMDLAMSLPRDEYGDHPFADLVAQGNGVTEGDIYELSRRIDE